MYGIPNMKLEKKIVNRRIELMKAEGVVFVTNADVGNNISADEIKENFDAVILACGSSSPRDINAEGRDANGIYFAVDFLKATTKSLLDSDLQDGNYISAKDKNVDYNRRRRYRKRLRWNFDETRLRFGSSA